MFDQHNQQQPARIRVEPNRISLPSIDDETILIALKIAKWKWPDGEIRVCGTDTCKARVFAAAAKYLPEMQFTKDSQPSMPSPESEPKRQRMR
ncbi:MAG: hypothetical protein LBP95_09115 [Deltaproteobacteria bacterium]|nr:hypothetical protein [Deltaproteobacteria bacterium]